MDQWEIRFRGRDGMLGKDMFVIRRYQGGTEVLRSDFETVDRLDYGAAVPATMYLPHDIYEALVKNILENNKPLNGSYVEGEVAAMREHLSDMRDIVFKDYPVKNIQVKTDEKN